MIVDFTTSPIESKTVSDSEQHYGGITCQAGLAQNLFQPERLLAKRPRTLRAKRGQVHVGPARHIMTCHTEH